MVSQKILTPTVPFLAVFCFLQEPNISEGLFHLKIKFFTLVSVGRI